MIASSESIFISYSSHEIATLAIQMNSPAERIQGFVDYCKLLSGDEKGEAHVFCDRLFQAFGHDGYKEAGATLEYRVKGKDHSTKFADLLWRPRVLIEMKSR